MQVNILSPYDKTKLIGNRLSQIENGAKTVLTSDELKSCKSVKDIVYKEFNTRKIPLMIKKVLPNGEILDIRIDESLIVI